MSQGIDEQLGFFVPGAIPAGYAACATMGTNWLINKICEAPGDAAVRNGWYLPEELEYLRETDSGYNIVDQLVKMVRLGRLFGGCCVKFDVESSDPKTWYENPLNLDGVRPGKYKGLVVIEPRWLIPELTQENLYDPASADFMRPTYWRIGNQRYHRSHLHFCVPFPVSDDMKYAYNFMGLPYPQLVRDRVYSAERSANEGPQLLLTKRSTVYKSAAATAGDYQGLVDSLEEWARLRDNYGVKIVFDGEDISQFDTALGDADSVIMTQYQLVAAAADMPVTELLGTTPKGFQSTGEHEAGSYRKTLEKIQATDLDPVLVKHYALARRSLGRPDSGAIAIQWEALDSPTAKEVAEIENLEAQTDNTYVMAGALDGEDIRNALIKNKNSRYFGIQEARFVDDTDEAD